MDKSYDFSGWATRNNLRCSDGRTIRKDCFKHQNGKKVPLVWNHQHDGVGDVLGHAILENREEGVYAYGYLNHTENGEMAKALLEHGDIESLSIYAGQLQQVGGDVIHGNIKEVSLVLAGANPGAVIDTVLEHSDGTISEGAFYMDDGCADLLMHSDKDEEEEEDEKEDKKNSEESDEESESKEEDKDDEDEEKKMENLKHSDEEQKESSKEKTVEDVFNSMSEEQKNVCYALVGQAIEDTKAELEGGKEDMKHNAFENTYAHENVLSHSDMAAIFEDAKKCGSLKQATERYLETELSHADGDDQQTYGIRDIDMLMPEYKNITREPEFVKRDQEWVSVVMNGVKHVPFSRIKTMFADITEDEARAKGYVKGTRKLEEVFGLLKRTTDPQTIYKKQKLDRDDIIDITDFDVVVWLKGEMRLMLNEEIARAILIGDGRSKLAQDKISEEHIRPILTDDEFYSVKKEVKFASGDTEDQKAKKVIRAAIKARKDYKGSGSPILFTTEDWLTDMLLLEDTTGRVIYTSEQMLATALRVSKIVTVPVMEGVQRKDEKSNKTFDTIGIIVNLNDYNVGADKGGAIALFDDFDIDYNQYKYLIETRCSGALVKWQSALVLESEAASQAQG